MSFFGCGIFLKLAPLEAKSLKLLRASRAPFFSRLNLHLRPPLKLPRSPLAIPLILGHKPEHLALLLTLN